MKFKGKKPAVFKPDYNCDLELCIYRTWKENIFDNCSSSPIAQNHYFFELTFKWQTQSGLHSLLLSCVTQIYGLQHILGAELRCNPSLFHPKQNNKARKKLHLLGTTISAPISQPAQMLKYRNSTKTSVTEVLVKSFPLLLFPEENTTHLNYSGSIRSSRPRGLNLLHAGHGVTDTAFHLPSFW